MGSSLIFEEKNTAKAVCTLAMPAMLGQLTTLIYNLADTYFITLTNDPAKVAAVTLCAPVLLILMSLGAVFGTGGSSLIARLLGENKEKQVAAASSFCFYTTIFLSMAVTAAGMLLVLPITALVGADSSNAAHTADYLRYIFLGTPFLMLGSGMVHIFRSAGLIRQATIGLVMGNVLNIVLDFVFIVLFHMGTAGAALATSLGFAANSVYFILCMYSYTKKGGTILPLSIRKYHPTKEIAGNVLGIGVPGALITVLLSVSNIFLNHFVAAYGSDAVAAYGIAGKINLIPTMLSVGLSQGVAPLIGFCYGAKEHDRLKKTMAISILYGLAVGVFFLGVFILGGNGIAGCFFRQKELADQTKVFLQILCISAPVGIITNMVTSYYQALGKAVPSLAITLCKNMVVFMPVILLLNHLFGLMGVAAAMPVNEYLIAILCLVMYRRESRFMGGRQTQSGERAARMCFADGAE